MQKTDELMMTSEVTSIYWIEKKCIIKAGALTIHLSHVWSALYLKSFEPVHEISNNVVCATSKALDQPAHTRRLIKAFASRLSIL